METQIDVMQVESMGPHISAGVIVFALVFYVFFAFCLAMIAKKTGRPFGNSFIMALIPIANVILMLQIAGKPWWWILLMLVPVVNLVITIIVWMKIAEARGKPGWWGIIMGLVPFVNLIFFLILAFGEEGKPATAAA